MHPLLLSGQEFNNLVERTKLCCLTPNLGKGKTPVCVFCIWIIPFKLSRLWFLWQDPPAAFFLLQHSSHSVVSTLLIHVLHLFLCVVWGRSMLFIGYFPSTITFTDILNKQCMRLFKDLINSFAKLQLQKCISDRHCKLMPALLFPVVTWFTSSLDI